MGIEPTARYSQAFGFEDQGSHQASVASDGVMLRLLRDARQCAGSIVEHAAECAVMRHG
jgi:hypothetical protein